MQSEELLETRIPSLVLCNGGRPAEWYSARVRGEEEREREREGLTLVSSQFKAELQSEYTQ